MIEWYVALPLMLAMHVIEDFHIQGKMADMKQSSFWEKYDSRYGGDYIPVLILHGIEWSVLVALPLMVADGFQTSAGLVVLIFVNALLHSYIDHLKCNEFRINLIQDQAIHITQIVLLCAFWGMGVV